MPETTWRKSRIALYLIALLFNFHTAIPIYINSSFLSQFTGDRTVGIVYTAAAILSIICFAGILRALRRFGNVKVTLFLCAIEFFSLVALSFAPSALSVIIFFMTSFTSIALINFTLDALLENFSTQNRTGDIRGIFYTFGNIGWVLAPIIAASLIDTNEYSRVFIVVAGILTLSILLIATSFRTFRDPDYSRVNFFHGLGEIFKDRDMRGIFIIDCLTQFFYSWMIIYTPIYLHQVIGFSWSTIGVLFSVMLIPFVLVGIPEGFFSDHGMGEKRFIAGGFVVVGIATLAAAFYGDSNAFVWGALLFLTRLGIASTEIMSDTYFFRKISGRDIQKMSIFRASRPVAYVVSSVSGTLLLTMTDIRGLLVILGILMFYGIRVALSLNDVK